MLARLRVLLFWGFGLFVAINITGFVMGVLLGPVLGVLLTVLLGLGYCFYFGKQGAWGFYTLMKNKKLVYAVYGALIVMIAAAMTSILDYFLTGTFRLGQGGILGLVAGALGGYMVDRKVKGTKLFGR